MATKEQMDTISAMALNDCAREMMSDGVDLSYSQADSLSADALAWLAERLGLTVVETDECVECAP